MAMQNTTATYPTSQDLEAMRGEFALADAHAGWHALATLRVSRGQPWNYDTGRAGPQQLAQERAYGIGGSTIGQRQQYRETARLMRSGLVLP